MGRPDTHITSLVVKALRDSDRPLTIYEIADTIYTDKPANENQIQHLRNAMSTLRALSSLTGYTIVTHQPTYSLQAVTDDRG